jgi:hypothetical protein
LIYLESRIISAFSLVAVKDYYYTYAVAIVKNKKYWLQRKVVLIDKKRNRKMKFQLL